VAAILLVPYKLITLPITADKQKIHQQQVLGRMWGKKNPYTLLVGVQVSETTLENNMEGSLKTKHRSAI
jgi:hypothetical protein